MTAPKVFPRVMLTGHRPQALTASEQAWSKQQLYNTLKRLKAFHGVEEVISGFALGADTWWAQYALKLELPLAAYIPFETQPQPWRPKDQEKWGILRSSAAREVVLGENYHVGLLHARNDAMIKDSELAVALWKQSVSKGGTFSAVQKLRKLEKPLILIDPELKLITTERVS